MKNNKLKKVIVSLMLVFCSLLFAGCIFTGGTTESIYVETTKSIYNFYLGNFISAQTGISSDVEKAKGHLSDQAKMNIAWSSQTKLKVDEMAIIASIECFNQSATQKELYLDDGEGIVIAKKESKYTCELFGEQFSFTINNNSGQYSVSYQKYSKNCSAIVKYDKQKSHITINITSYYQNYDGSTVRFDEFKDFYNLKNNNTAVRFNTIDYAGQTSTKYSFNIYKRVVDFSLKVSQVMQMESEITEDILSSSQFTKSTTNDLGGYIFTYNSSALSENNKLTMSTFGSVDLW